MNVFGAVANATVNTAINVTAAAAGATVTTYVIGHDACNDEDLSVIVGAAGGVGTFCVVRGALKGVKNGTIAGVTKVKTALSRKTKKGSTNP